TLLPARSDWERIGSGRGRVAAPRRRFSRRTKDASHTPSERGREGARGRGAHLSLRGSRGLAFPSAWRAPLVSFPSRPQDAVTVRDGALLFEAAPLEGRSDTREEVQVLADGYTTNAPCRGHLPSASPRHPTSVRNGNSEQSQPQDEQCIPIVQIRLHF
ncbi:unnamed protein product, partial [Urochloa humidicola]